MNGMYQSRNTDENIRQQGRHTTRTQNYSNPPRHRRRQGDQYNSAIVKQQIFLLFGSLLGLGVWYLTPASDYAVQFMLMQVPISADMDLGREALQQLPQKRYDKYWSPKIELVGWQLVESSRDENARLYQWDFGILPDSTTVNAFALPGGVIRVTSALLERLQPSEGELAALIGHEMGHVLHRHSQARILQQQILAYALQALFYQDDDPHQETFGEAIGELLLKSADWLGQQSFSRANEYQADASSWDLLISSRHYNPQALQSLLEKLWDHNGRQGGTTSWESTHPGTFDRIHALDEKWKALEFRERRKLAKNTIL